MKNIVAFFSLALTTLVLLGCTGQKRPEGMPALVPCSIKVTQEGTSLADATVSITPIGGDAKWTADGRTDSSGLAKMYTWSLHEGVVPGKFKVVVGKVETETLPPQSSDDPTPSKTPDSFNLVEEQYGELGTTTLEIEVAKGTKEYTVDVGKAVRNKILERH